MSRRKGGKGKGGGSADGPKIDPSPELEEALREATEAAEARDGGAQSGTESASAETAAAPPGSAADPAAEGGDAGIEKDLAAELAAAEDRLLRLQADFENFRRRSLKEREESYQYGHLELVKDLLPSVDNLERALDAAREAAGGEAEGLVQGVELVLRELVANLAKHGVTPIEAEGRPFDPAFHEAMAQAAHPDAPANTVVQVVQKGYTLRDRLLRPAGVIVSKGPDA